MQLQENPGADVEFGARVDWLDGFGDQVGRLGTRGAFLGPIVGGTAARRHRS